MVHIAEVAYNIHVCDLQPAGKIAQESHSDIKFYVNYWIETLIINV